MANLNKLFKLTNKEDEHFISSSPKEENSLVNFNLQDDFLAKLLNFLPTPENELENIKKEEEILEINILEVKEVIDRIEFRLNEITSEEELNSSNEKPNSEEFLELTEKKDYYIILLESFESDFEYIVSQKKSLHYLIDDSPEGDDKFEEQLPELLTKTFVNTKKKMEDVNSVVKILEEKNKKNKIEQCIDCGLQFRDAQGRKTALKHFHLSGFDDLKKYKPIICLDCYQAFLTSKNESIVSFEEDIDNHNELCKKGNKVFNSKIILNIPEFKEKANKFITMENKEFIENIRNEGKKSLFDSFF
jgi:hypothetical protein